MEEKGLKILMVSAEVDPFFKTGGLGDVVGALPKALNKLGNDTRVIMPLYDKIPGAYRDKMKYLGYIYVDLNWRHQYCGIFSLELNKTTFYFLDNEYYYKRYSVYDDLECEKFAFLDKAIFDVAKFLDFKPNVIHIHDWHTGPVAALMNDVYCYDPFFSKTKVVYTIHNLAYQGIFDKYKIFDMLPLRQDKYNDTSVINYMALGIQYAHKVTTVSPTYAGEILTNENGEGLQHLLRREVNKLSGILNGIDKDIYNSKKDKQIEYNFDLKEYQLGKLENKKALLNELGFDVESSLDKPLIAIISRMASQKGMDLVLSIMDKLLEKDVRVVILGNGNKDMERSFDYFNKANHDKYRAILKFDSALSHRIYAAADMFLMPSVFEPCGLTQMICLRYGTVPIVRLVGGLKDSIEPYNEYKLKGNGFGFYNYNDDDFYNTICYALSVYERKELWHNVITNGSKCDFSWNASAKKYIELYKQA